jgi:hypothetical protein
MSTLGIEDKPQTISSMAEVLMLNPCTMNADSRFMIENLLADFEIQNLKSTRKDSIFYWLKLQNHSSKKDVRFGPNKDTNNNPEGKELGNIVTFALLRINKSQSTVYISTDVCIGEDRGPLERRVSIFAHSWTGRFPASCNQHHMSCH